MIEVYIPASFKKSSASCPGDNLTEAKDLEKNKIFSA